MAKKPTIEKEKLASFSSGPIFALGIMLVIIIVGTLLAREYLLEPQKNEQKEETEEVLEENDYVEVLDDKIQFIIPENKDIGWRNMFEIQNAKEENLIEVVYEGFGNILITRYKNNSKPDQIIINDQEINGKHFVNGIASVGEKFLIHYYEGDAKTADLMIYNREGNELFAYSNLENQGFYLEKSRYYYVDDAIFLTGTKLIDGQIYLEEKVIPLCDRDKWLKIKDEPVTVRFKVNYQHENFSDLQIDRVISTIEKSYQEADCE